MLIAVVNKSEKRDSAAINLPSSSILPLTGCPSV